jgi:hypothetical protein
MTNSSETATIIRKEMLLLATLNKRPQCIFGHSNDWVKRELVEKESGPMGMGSVII